MPIAPVNRASVTVITDLATLRSDPITGELALSALNPGVSVEQVREATRWNLKLSDKVSRTPDPTAEELHVLRELHARTALACNANRMSQ